MLKLHRDYTYTNIPKETFPCIICETQRATISKTKVCYTCWSKLNDFARYLLLKKVEKEYGKAIND